MTKETIEPDLVDDFLEPILAAEKGDKLDMISMPEMVDQFGVARNTIIRLMEKENFPKPFKIGRGHRWLRSDVVKWLNKRRSE